MSQRLRSRHFLTFLFLLLRYQFVTLNGISEFIYYLQNYNGMNYEYGGDDDGGNDDGGYNGDYDDLPACEQSNGNYIGLGCADDGSFALVYFSDQYCLQPTGSTYDKLRQLNRGLRSYKSCSTIYNGGNGNNNGGSLPAMLVSSSNSCSSLDSSLCTDNSAMKSRRSHTSTNHHIPGVRGLGGKSWLTKLKYVVAGMLLVASFVMFTGILFTNRRRRRALMQRKYRQSKRRKSKSRSSRAKSKSRDDRSTRDKSTRRSKSKHRPPPEGAEPAEEGGVFT